MSTLTRPEVKTIHNELDALLTDFFKKHDMQFHLTGARFTSTEFKMSVKATKKVVPTVHVSMSSTAPDTVSGPLPTVGALLTRWGGNLDRIGLHSGIAAPGSIVWINDRGFAKRVTIENAAKTCYHVTMTDNPGPRYRIRFVSCYMTRQDTGL